MATAPDEDLTSLLGEFCMPTLDDVAAESLLSQSQYAQVVFHDVAETYPLDCDIVCRFTLTSGVQHLPGDTVAVMRVGWTKAEEAVVSQPVAASAFAEQKEFELAFKATELPRDLEFYQLCYLSKGEVRGASVPFQFRHATNEELTVEECGDMAVVRSQAAVAQELRWQLTSLRQALGEAQQAMTAAQERETQAQERLAQVVLKHYAVKAKLEEETKAAKREAKETTDLLKEEKTTSGEALKSAQERVNVLQFENTGLKSLMESLKHDLASAERELGQARSDIQAITGERELLAERLQLSQGQIASLTQALQEAKEVGEWAATQRSAQQEVLRQKEMLDAVQQAKELATREMISATQRADKVQAELAEAKAQVEKLQQQLEGERAEHALRHEEQHQQWQAERESLLAQLTRLVSSAQHTDANRIRAKELEKELAEAKDRILVLQEQVRDVTGRLADQEEEHEQLQKQLAQLQAQRQQQRPPPPDEAVLAECDALRAQNEELLAQQDQLRQQYEQLHARHAEQQVQESRLQEELQRSVQLRRMVEELQEVQLREVQLHKEQLQKQQEEAGAYRVRPEEGQSQVAEALDDASYMQEREKASIGVRTLSSRLNDIMERDQQVHAEEVQTREELQDLKDTARALEEESGRLEVAADQIRQRYSEAEDMCDAHRTTLLQRDLEIAKEKLSEQHVCQESATLRMQELRLRLQELAQERAVLAQQQAQASSSLCTLSAMLAVPHAAGAAAQHAVPWGASPEVKDLRARLAACAEAYQRLYQEKMHVQQRGMHATNMLRQMKMEASGGNASGAGSGAAGSSSSAGSSGVGSSAGSSSIGSGAVSSAGASGGPVAEERVQGAQEEVLEQQSREANGSAPALACPFCAAVFPACGRDLYHAHFDSHLP